MRANNKIRLEAHINRLLLIVLMFVCPNLLYGHSAGGLCDDNGSE